MRHGGNKRFSCRGVEAALGFFRRAGHRCVAFLVDYLLDEERVDAKRRAALHGVRAAEARELPDDVPRLRRLVDADLLVATPPQDYDDSYCIECARYRHSRARSRV